MNLLYLPINLFRSENDERFLTDIWQCCSAARDCWPSLALTASLLEILFAKIVFDYECLIWYRLLVLGIHMS